MLNLTVRDLKEALSEYDDNMRIVIESGTPEDGFEVYKGLSSLRDQRTGDLSQAVVVKIRRPLLSPQT